MMIIPWTGQIVVQDEFHKPVGTYPLLHLQLCFLTLHRTQTPNGLISMHATLQLTPTLYLRAHKPLRKTGKGVFPQFFPFSHPLGKCQSGLGIKNFRIEDVNTSALSLLWQISAPLQWYLGLPFAVSSELIQLQVTALSPPWFPQNPPFVFYCPRWCLFANSCISLWVKLPEKETLSTIYIQYLGNILIMHCYGASQLISCCPDEDVCFWLKSLSLSN